MAILPPTSPTTLIGGLAFGRNPSKHMRHKSIDQQNSAHYTYFLIITLEKTFTSDSHIPRDLSLLSPSLDVLCVSKAQTPSQYLDHNNFLEHPGFSIRAGGRQNSPATLYDFAISLTKNLCQICQIAWKIFLQKLYFIYTSPCFWFLCPQMGP